MLRRRLLHIAASFALGIGCNRKKGSCPDTNINIFVMIPQIEQEKKEMPLRLSDDSRARSFHTLGIANRGNTFSSWRRLLQAYHVSRHASICYSSECLNKQWNNSKSNTQNYINVPQMRTSLLQPIFIAAITRMHQSLVQILRNITPP